MKKHFEEPVVEIEKFQTEDVIATSGYDNLFGENELQNRG